MYVRDRLQGATLAIQLPACNEVARPAICARQHTSNGRKLSPHLAELSATSLFGIGAEVSGHFTGKQM
jgi:hypothetical protein